MFTPAGLSSLETACCLVFGGEGEPVEPARRTPAPADPASALIDALAGALRRPPCVVAFSGGRDSSLVLAAAAAASRRDGLPPPVPVSLRFPGAPESEETQWQERVVAHLGLDDWVRVEVPEGLDAIGTVAQQHILRHGLLFPPNAHLVAPMAEHAGGGTILAGLGGDELFGLWLRRRLADVAAGRERPARRDVLRVAAALAPARARREVERRRAPAPAPAWLRPDARRELRAVLAAQDASMSLRWDRHATAVRRARSLHLASRDLGRVAADGGAAFAAPLLDERFADALAAAGGWRGFGGRDETMQALFGSLLPPDVLGRRHKATFNEVFFTAETRRFARAWSGRGLDEAVVDPEAVRATWLAEQVDYRSALLLQSAWLADHREAAC